MHKDTMGRYSLCLKWVLHMTTSLFDANVVVKCLHLHKPHLKNKMERN